MVHRPSDNGISGHLADAIPPAVQHTLQPATNFLYCCCCSLNTSRTISDSPAPSHALDQGPAVHTATRPPSLPAPDRQCLACSLRDSNLTLRFSFCRSFCPCREASNALHSQRQSGLQEHSGGQHIVTSLGLQVTTAITAMTPPYQPAHSAHNVRHYDARLAPPRAQHSGMRTLPLHYLIHVG